MNATPEPTYTIPETTQPSLLPSPATHHAAAGHTHHSPGAPHHLAYTGAPAWPLISALVLAVVGTALLRRTRRGSAPRPAY